MESWGEATKGIARKTVNMLTLYFDQGLLLTEVKSRQAFQDDGEAAIAKWRTRSIRSLLALTGYRTELCKDNIWFGSLMKAS